MDAKVTIRLPQRLLNRLRARSQEERRSLNETALRTLEQGLGEAPTEEGWRALGPLLEGKPPTRYNVRQINRLRAALGSSARRLEEDLDWVRGEA